MLLALEIEAAASEIFVLVLGMLQSLPHTPGLARWVLCDRYSQIQRPQRETGEALRRPSGVKERPEPPGALLSF